MTDLSYLGRQCEAFEAQTKDDLVWRPPLLIVVASILVWVWIIFEIYQLIHRAPGLFE
ncbi:hypothetical protein GYB14_16540 [bacterium]|nr:hypothetical protein [bacterium]